MLLVLLPGGGENMVDEGCHVKPAQLLYRLNNVQFWPLAAILLGKTWVESNRECAIGTGRRRRVCGGLFLAGHQLMAVALHAPRKRKFQQGDLDGTDRQAGGPTQFIDVDGGRPQRRQ